jgi:hypothetical protein
MATRSGKLITATCDPTVPSASRWPTGDTALALRFFAISEWPWAWGNFLVVACSGWHFHNVIG